MSFDSPTTKDFFYMLFVENVNTIAGTPGKNNWFKMDDAEKHRWRQFANNFRWPDYDPDWME